MEILFGLIFLIPLVLTLVDFLHVLFARERLLKKSSIVLDVFIVIIFPILFLAVMDSGPNDCCSESAVFSPNHRATIYFFIIINMIAYFISALKYKLLSPIIEVLINSILLSGIVLVSFILVHFSSFGIIFNIAIILLFLIQLIQNHQKFMDENSENQEYDKWEAIAWQILRLNPFIKYPILIVLFIPIFTIITSLLMLFGQKPDSIVKAFTDTYKHGFSQLDYLCDNVQCGGHFLCSVAANGHKNIVQPKRYGERGGGKIICNRQLLIANAFEEILEQKTPQLHLFIRTKYNKVGNFIHRYYGVFNNKLLADMVYVFMKPLEWCFLFVIYVVDKKPENRIAVQYLNRKDRTLIKQAQQKP